MKLTAQKLRSLIKQVIKENRMILREWASRDNFLFDFQYVNYEPSNVTLKNND